MLIYVGTPTAESVQSKTVSMLIGLNTLLLQNGHQTIFDTTCHNAIHFSRNKMAYNAYEKGADVLLFLDSDVYVKPADLYKIITSNKDVTAIAYRKKKYSEEYCCLIESDENGYPIVDNEGWIELSAAATGALAIKRHVIEKMYQAYKHRNYISSFGDKLCAIFEYELHEGKYWGEDYNFCRRWREMGGKIWLWPNADTMHIGTEYHNGNIHFFLMNSKEEKMEYQGNSIQGWMMPNELEWLYQTSRKMNSVVEIGSWRGRSTHAICTGCNGPVYAVDHFMGSDEGSHHAVVNGDNIYSEFIENVGHFPNLKVIRSDSESAAKEIDFVDMVFIDGEHTYEAAMKDISIWKSKAKKIIAGHDYGPDWPGVKAAVEQNFKEANICGTIWWVEL